MSHQLISRSPDLKRLRDEGYDIAIVDNYLVLRNVPYVNENKQIKSGTLVSDLSLAGNVTDKPGTHVIFFAGEFPCRWDGARIAQLEHETPRRQLTKELFVDFSFSHKPPTGYTDYHHKLTTYLSVITGQARKLDDTATAQVYPVVHETDSDGPFQYLDTASSRADIMMATQKLVLKKVAIVGLGGTGSYVLDFVAKTPVEEIHLFDGDLFSQHNAFRSPGAASIQELNARLAKVAYFRARYSEMHKNIVAHEVFIDASNAAVLDEMDFVFLCLDRGGAKAAIVEALERAGKPFVDVGMGINLVDESLLGILRVTTSTPTKRDHVREPGRIPFADGGNDDYAKNIQVADLNALNAVLAVIKWKKLCGFYHDAAKEHHSTFTLDTNMLLNEDTV